MHNAPIKKSIHPTFIKANSTYCGKLLKDFIGGDLTNPELSPAIANDPILRQQCERFGYMTIQIGDELRTVYCNGGDVGKGIDCPNCGTPYCLDHMRLHLGATLDQNAFKVQGPAFGGENPPVYDEMQQGANPRAQMAMTDEDKDNDIRTKREKSVKIRKGLYDAAAQGKGGEHEFKTRFIVSLPPVQRAQLEAHNYKEEYMAAASPADLATEFASRGKDEAFQEQLEKYAHAGGDEFVRWLYSLVQQGYLRACPGCGGLLAPENYVPPQPQ